jgi:hypothetical protein
MAALAPLGSARADTISGSLDDWRGAVCKSGSYHEGGSGVPFPDATAQAFCNTGSANVWIGQFDSEYLMHNDLAAMRMMNSHTSVVNSGSGLITMFATNGGSRALSPLTQFGFQLS